MRFTVSTYNQHQMKAITEGFMLILMQLLGWYSWKAAAEQVYCCCCCIWLLPNDVCITWTRSERTSRATKGMRRSLSSCAMIWPTRPKPAMTTWPRSSSTSPSLGCSACTTRAFTNYTLTRHGSRCIAHIRLLVRPDFGMLQHVSAQ